VITQAGAVISGLNITGVVSIEAPNVTLENCVITSPSWSAVVVQEGVTGAVVQNCTINGVGTGNEGSTGISGQGTFLNNNIYNVENGISLQGSAVIEGNYIHDMNASGSPHYDGIQIDGNVSNVTISGNSIINNNGSTSAVMIDNDFGAISNIQVSNNLLVGGGYTVYSDARATSAPITGVSFTNNHIGGGQFGPTDFENNNPTYTGNVNDGVALAATLNTGANHTTATGTGSATGSGAGSGSGSTAGSGTHSGSGSSLPPTQTGDTVAPDAPIMSKDTVVNNTVQVSGTAEAGSTIKLYDGTTLLGTTHAASNGAWSLATSVLSQGSHTLAATATDAAGNVSDLSQPVDPVIGSVSSGQHTPSQPADTVAPGAPVITGDTVVNDTVQVSGTAEAGSTIKLYDGSTLLGTTHVASDGDWSFTTSALSPGAHAFAASATDAAGNTSHLSQAVDPVIGSGSSGIGSGSSGHQHHSPSPPADSVAPDAPVITGDSVVHNTVRVSGTAEAGSTIKLYDGSTLLGTTHAASDGDWNLTTPVLAKGAHALAATATDAAGNTSGLSDAVDPVIGTTSLNGGSTWTHNHLTGSSGTLLQFTGVQQNHDQTVTLTGTADSGSQLSVYDGTKTVGSVTTDTGGHWTFTTSASPNHAHSFSSALVDSDGDTVATTTGAAIVGTNSQDKLVSTSGNDILTGKGGADTFVFAPNFGHDTITNFAAQGAGHGTIDFSKSVFDNFATVLAHASQDGHDVTISAGSDTLTLKNMKVGDLNSHDFHFG
jgi:hypothetical protein